MLKLILLYFVSTGIHTIILALITFILKNAFERRYFSKLPGDDPPLNRRLRRIGIIRYQHLFQLFVSYNLEYLLRFSWIAFAHQCVTMVIIIWGLIVNPYKFVPLLAVVPEIDDRWQWVMTRDLALFWVATGFHHWLPLLILNCALLRRVSLPFFLTLTGNRTPLSDEIAHGEEESEDFAFIHLTRFQNSEKTFIYAYCRNDRLGKIFKVALCQRKEVGARPQCFLYSDDERFEQIIPAPVTVNLLEEIFHLLSQR